jgi:hypothetical protein
MARRSDPSFRSRIDLSGPSKMTKTISGRFLTGKVSSSWKTLDRVVGALVLGPGPDDDLLALQAEKARFLRDDLVVKLLARQLEPVLGQADSLLEVAAAVFRPLFGRLYARLLVRRAALGPVRLSVVDLRFVVHRHLALPVAGCRCIILFMSACWPI